MPSTKIASKAANALLDVEAIDVVKFGFRGLAQITGGPDPIEMIRSQYGGLWVGGTATLYEDRLEFEPNGMNRALHKGDLSISIKLRDVDKVEQRFGILSGIIDISAGRSVLSIRTFGAKGFASQIEQARDAAR